MTPNHKLERADAFLAVLITLVALAAYVRTLAPDLLYGDSAEFQTLAYTFGTTHSTGYPTYLLLARLFGFLPLGTPAWRINFFSAAGAAVTVGSIYLLARYLTPSRIGAALGSLALALSGVFWSQAIIAEVYTPALAWLAIILILLWQWDARFPDKKWSLFGASTLAGFGLGMHMYVGLIAPAAVVWVFWRVLAAKKPHRWDHLSLACLGAGLGIVLLLAGFALLEWNDPPSNFIDTAILPSRSIWTRPLSAFESAPHRIWLTLSGMQWQDAMFPGGKVYRSDEIREYLDLLMQEFSWLSLLCAFLGFIVTMLKKPRLGTFFALSLVTMLFAISNYHPGDQYLFYLPTFVLIAVVTGIGAGFALDRIRVWTTPPTIEQTKPSSFPAYYLFAALVCGTLILLPFAASRWHALQTRTVPFAANTYAYPIEDLQEPRQQAARRVSFVPDDAVLVLRWRGLYSAIYLAHVEQKRTGITFIEATPHGGTGQLAGSLIDDLEQMVRAGRPVFVDEAYENLRDRFRVFPAPINGLYRLSIPNTS
ncbi:MAG: DUF2723 domain-containing protein [Anaerolineae bacterium]|nr:DUF2723 domain-containing protein [Anaerolineae bacterium]